MANDNAAPVEETPVEKVYTTDTFADQEDKTTEYSKLLEFLESPIGKKYCFGMVQIESRGDTVFAVSGRVNKIQIRVTSAKVTNGQSNFTNRKRAMGNNFTIDTAKVAFVELAYAHDAWRNTASDATSEESQNTLKSWDAMGSLIRFLPNARLEVCDFNTNSATIQVRIDGKPMGRSTEASLHTAKHVAACKVLGSPAYKELFAKSWGVSYGCVMSRLACPTSEISGSMVRLLRVNNLVHNSVPISQYEEATGLTAVNALIKADGADIEAAAKKTLDILSNITLEGSNKGKGKKRKGPKGNSRGNRRHSDGENKQPKMENSLQVLNHMGMKNSNNPDFSYMSESKQGPFTCTVTVGGHEFSASASSKKEAKTAAADTAAMQLYGMQSC